jgi:Ca2+-binding RTX toxin-like protein
VTATFTSAQILSLVSIGADEPGTVTLADAAQIEGAATGLESKGLAVTYHVVSATEIDGVTSDGRTIFTLVDTAGTFTFTLVDQVDHLPLNAASGDNDASATIDLAGAFVVTDADGDFVPLDNGATVAIENDVPVAFIPEASYIINDGSSSATVGLNFTAAVGADEPGSMVFNITDNSVATDLNGDKLTFGGHNILILGDGTGTLTGFVDENDNNTVDPGETDKAFQIVLDPSTDTYTFTGYEPVSNGTEIHISDLTGVGGGNVNFKGIGADDTTNPLDVLMSGSDSVNTNSTQIGIDGGNSISGSEKVRFDFLDNLVTDAGQTSGFNYTDHVSATQFEQTVSFVLHTETSFTVKAILADNDQVFLGDASGESSPTIATVTIFDASHNVVDTQNVADGNDSFVAFNGDGTVTLNHIQQDYSYQIRTATEFSAVEVDAVTGANPFKLGIFSVTTESNAQPSELQFNVTGTDYDGDGIGSTLDVNFLPDDGNNFVGTANDDAALTGNANNNIMAGLGGNDQLSGLDGSDTLIGGAGDDTLTGGTGNDTFKYTATSDSTVAAHDTITDFTDGSDVIDFSNIAGITTDGGDVGSAPATVAANTFVYYQSGADTVVLANASGSPEAAASSDMMMVLTGITANSLHPADFVHA